MNDQIHPLDAYIDAVSIDKYTPNMLFTSVDLVTGEIRACYHTPMHIARSFWKRHLEFSQMEGYYDTAEYLMNKSRWLDYPAVMRAWDRINVMPANKITNDTLSNIALLFLSTQAALTENMLFGYVVLPDQKKTMVSMFNTYGFAKPKALTTHLIEYATDATVYTIYGELVKRT